MADYIYGELNDAVLSVDYEGKDTETASVSIDPTRREIGVDVKKAPNALTITSQGATVVYDGSRPAEVSVGSYEIREIGSSGESRSYGLFQNGVEGALGMTICVPSPKNLLSAEVLSCEEAGTPLEGLKEGDLYARFTCASRDGGLQENYFVYMPLNAVTSAADAMVDAERSRAEGAEGALRDSIAEEASARQEADSSLEGKTRHISAGDTYTDFDGIVTFKGNVNVDGYLSNSGMTQFIVSVRDSVDKESAAREAADESINASLAAKQDALVSGESIKTINGQSLLGQGNIDVSGAPADSYTKEESDGRYARATEEVLASGAVTSIEYSKLEPYSFVIMHGYKNNVDSPNQLTFVMVPKFLTEGEANLIVPGMAMSTNWNYGVVFTKEGGTVSWETDVDYGGDRQFIVTNILGVH